MIGAPDTRMTPIVAGRPARYCAIQSFRRPDLAAPGMAVAQRCARRLQECDMLKVLGWVIGIIFLIGLLVVIGVFDFIF